MGLVDVGGIRLVPSPMARPPLNAPTSPSGSAGSLHTPEEEPRRRFGAIQALVASGNGSPAPCTRLEEEFERPPRNLSISFSSGRCSGAGTPRVEKGFEDDVSLGAKPIAPPRSGCLPTSFSAMPDACSFLEHDVVRARHAYFNGAACKPWFGTSGKVVLEVAYLSTRGAS